MKNKSPTFASVCASMTDSNNKVQKVNNQKKTASNILVTSKDENNVKISNSEIIKIINAADIQAKVLNVKEKMDGSIPVVYNTDKDRDMISDHLDQALAKM